MLSERAARSLGRLVARQNREIAQKEQELEMVRQEAAQWRHLALTRAVDVRTVSGRRIPYPQQLLISEAGGAVIGALWWGWLLGITWHRSLVGIGWLGLLWTRHRLELSGCPLQVFVR